MGIQIGIVGTELVPILSCDVCKEEIESVSDGLFLVHNLAGLGEPKSWVCHRRCMGPATYHISIATTMSKLLTRLGIQKPQ